MKKVFYSFVAAAMFAGVISCGTTENEVVTEEAAVEENVEATMDEAVEATEEAAEATEEAADAVEEAAQ